MASGTWHLEAEARDDATDAARICVVDGELTVGRSRSCGLVLEEGYVSRRHARLWTEAERLFVEDLGSANGTFVNGEPVLGPTPLHPGDRVTFDESTFRVVVRTHGADRDPDATYFRARPVRTDAGELHAVDGGPEAPDHEGDDERTGETGHALADAEPAPEEAPVADAESTVWAPDESSEPALLGISAPVKGHIFQLPAGAVLLGSAHDCELVLAGKGVRARHARLEVGAGGCRVVSLVPDAPVRVEGRAIREAWLRPGQRLRLGRVGFVFDTTEALERRLAADGAAPEWVWLLAGFVGTAALLALVLAWLG